MVSIVNINDKGFVLFPDAESVGRARDGDLLPGCRVFGQGTRGRPCCGLHRRPRGGGPQHTGEVSKAHTHFHLTFCESPKRLRGSVKGSHPLAVKQEALRDSFSTV